MQVNRLEHWLSPFKATVEGQSLCALENRPEILPGAQLCINSKQLKDGDIFLALPGVSGHGNQFIEVALLQGAALVITDQLLPGQNELAEDPRVLLWPDLAAARPALPRSLFLRRECECRGSPCTDGDNGSRRRLLSAPETPSRHSLLVS